MEFEYVGYNADRRMIKGRISAQTEGEAKDKLFKSGYQILKLKPLSQLLNKEITLSNSIAKQEEVIMFSRQLALLLESGVGIVQGLELLKLQTTNKKFSNALGTIVVDLRSGQSLSSAMEKFPQLFNKMYTKIIAVGEQTGQLEGVLRNLANYIEQSYNAIKKIKQAMMYPLMVLGLGVIVGIIAVTFVLPPITKMFKSFGGEIPLITRILLDSVQFASEYGVYFILILMIIFWLLFMYVKTPQGCYQKDNLLLKIPVMGRLNQVNNLGRICRSFSLLFKSGLPLPDILRLTADSSGNRVVSKALMNVEKDIIRGESLAASMRKNPLFLPLMVEMTKVGEETGNLDNTLTIVADSFEIESADKLQTLLGMVEPLMTIAIGLVVGFLALSIFIPIYSSMSLVGG